MISLELLFLLYMVINALSLYVYNNALQLFFERKDSQKVSYKIFAMVIYLSIGTGTYFWGLMPVINLFITIISMLLVANCYEGKFIEKIIFVMFWHGFLILVELLVGVLLGLVVGISVNEVIANELLQVTGTVLCGNVELIFVKLLQEYKGKKDNLEKFVQFETLKVIVIPLFSVVLISILFYISNTSVGAIQWVIVIALICLIMMNLFVYYLFDKLRTSEQMKYQHKLLQTQMAYYIEQENNLYAAQEKIYAVKHDLKHHLLYIKTKLDENTQEALQELNEQVSQLVGDIAIDHMQIYTRNPKVNRLLNYKLLEARKRDIELDVQVSIRENTDINEDVLHIILGNAIDNAVENFDASEAEQKKLIVKVFEDNHNLFLSISNPYVGELRFKNGLPITKKEDKAVHGIGLQNIKKIVDEKNGCLRIVTADHVFKLEVLLYNEVREP